MKPAAAGITDALSAPGRTGRTAIVAYITAGFPSPDRFAETLSRVAAVADAVEIGIPFSDPIADGATIQRASRKALADGMSVARLFAMLEAARFEPTCPLLFMSYLNPLLSFGFERVAAKAAASHASAFVVPDLPFEDSGPLREALDREGLALVHLVTPATPPDRLGTICRASHGFVYAVTIAGVTGGELPALPTLTEYLDRVRAVSPVPIVAGFGVRSGEEIRAIGRHARGVVVGSALLEAVERGEDAAAFLTSLASA